MKKFFKKSAASVIAATALLAGMTFPVLAMPDDENVRESYALEDSYDINNENYRRKVDSLGKRIAYEEEFVAYLNTQLMKLPAFKENIEDCAITHVYNNDNPADGEIAVGYIVESIVPGTNKKARKFEQMVYYLNVFRNYDEVFTRYTADEINAFLEEENLKAKIVTTDESQNVLHYYDTSEENVVATFLALNKKFGAKLEGYCPDMEHFDVFYDNSMIGGKDGEMSVRDCAFIANNIAQGHANGLPLSADYNSDGVVDVRDAADIARDLAKKISK